MGGERIGQASSLTMTPKTRKRPAADRANPEIESRKNCHDNNRIPPHTPALIAKVLGRMLKRLDDLADAGANVTVMLGFIDERGERTGVFIVDRATVEAIGPPPIGLTQVQVGTAVHDA